MPVVNHRKSTYRQAPAYKQSPSQLVGNRYDEYQRFTGCCIPESLPTRGMIAAEESMLLEQGSILDDTVPEEHAISNLNPIYRVPGVGLEPATVMSIETSCCIEQNAFRSAAYC
eukprot:6213180-Pleurochrysis_carterae.AAC.2